VADFRRGNTPHTNTAVGTVTDSDRLPFICGIATADDNMSY